jgi:hypothetical protein
MSYTFAKNIVTNGVDFNNQFDFSNTKALSLLDQRHRVVLGLVYQSQYHGSGMPKAFLSGWMLSTSTQYGSGRPYTGLLTAGCVGTSLATCTGGRNLNDSAFNYGQGIAAAGPSPNFGLNAFEGPWSGGVDLSVERSFRIREGHKISLRATGFNMMNHANYYVQSGNSGQGVNQTQYRPVGSNCGNGSAVDQTCYLLPNNGVGGFGSFLVVGQNTGSRIFQFAMIYRF